MSNESLRVTVVKTFLSVPETVTTADSLNGSTARDISLVNTATFFVLNIGAVNSANVVVQTSPDGITWVDNFFGGSTPGPGDTFVDTPSYSLKYARVAYKSAAAGNPTTLQIVFQAQS